MFSCGECKSNDGNAKTDLEIWIFTCKVRLFAAYRTKVPNCILLNDEKSVGSTTDIKFTLASSFIWRIKLFSGVKLSLETTRTPRICCISRQCSTLQQSFKSYMCAR